MHFTTHALGSADYPDDIGLLLAQEDVTQHQRRLGYGEPQLKDLVSQLVLRTPLLLCLDFGDGQSVQMASSKYSAERRKSARVCGAVLFLLLLKSDDVGVFQPQGLVQVIRQPQDHANQARNFDG